MVKREKYNAPSIFTDRAAEINFDDGSVRLLDQLSGTFLDVAQKAHRANLQKEVTQAQKDGALAGFEAGGGFKPSKRRGIVHKAYNDSGIQTATVRMSSASQQAIQRIALNNPGNPFAQKEQMDNWSDTFAGELPDELIQPFRQSFGELSNGQLTKANSELADIRQGEAIANFNTLESTITNSIDLYSPGIFEAGAVGTDAAKAVQTLRKNYVELLAQNGPGAEYIVGGYNIPAGEGRSNALSVEEIGSKLQEFDKHVLMSSVKGNFVKELEAGRGVSSYFNFVKGSTALTTVGLDGKISQAPVGEILDREQQEKIATYMRTHISTLNSLEDAADRKSDRARDKYNEGLIDHTLQGSFKVTELPDGQKVVEGNAEFVRLQYLNAVNDESGLVRQETIDTMLSMMETIGSGDIKDPAILSSTKLDLIEGVISSASQLPVNGLGDDGRMELIQLSQKINSGQHWSNSKRYSTMLDFGKATLAPEAATGFTLFGDPNKKSAANFAEFKSRLMEAVLGAEAAGTLPVDMNTMPGKEEFDVQKTAREIIKEIEQRDKVLDTDPEMKQIKDDIKAQTAILNTGTATEAKQARNKLKKLREEQSRMQLRNQTGIR